MESTFELPENITTLPDFAEVPFRFEANFPYYDSQQWLRRNWTAAFFYISAYLMVLLFLSSWMKDKKRLEFRIATFFWNLSLAIFSIIGTYRTLPELVRLLSEEGGYHRSICDTRSLHSPVWLTWCILFSISKVFELGDTVLISLRKRPLTFLHVYHHCTVLVFTWYATAQITPTGRWFTTMNYLVHSIMYTYYALQGLRLFTIPRRLSAAITTLQIVQMLVGIAVNLYGFLAIKRGIQCDMTKDVIMFTAVIYISYLLLFLKFFCRAYLFKRSESSKKVD